ncbi:MAG: HAD family hydrolase [Pirellulales bacterium]
MQPPRFIYFDLGNVLLFFDHRRAARQMAEVAGVPEEVVWQLVFAGDLERQYETGEVDDHQFYEHFCRETGSRPDARALALAGSEIFTPNIALSPIVAALDSAGYRLGILSNTSPAHWHYCSGGRYVLIDRAFDVYALSYELGACKPDARIFAQAAELAGVAPQEIFFVDDIAGHVAGACAAGFDAVQYTTPEALAAELRRRGLEFNY